LNGRLDGKRAFVTGGSRGIGAAIVRRLAADGADVAFTYVSKPDVASELARDASKRGPKVRALQADSGDPAAIRAAADQAAKDLGGIDIVVNSAGIALIAPIDGFALADLDRMLDVNVRAALIAVQATLPHMPNGGRIVTIGSCNAERMPFAGGAVYATTKAALVGLVKGLARDLGPRGITVNNIQPGPIDTEMNPAEGAFADSLRSLMALPRYGSADEVAAMVAYLVGPEAGFVTGASLTIDGGFTA